MKHDRHCEKKASKGWRCYCGHRAAHKALSAPAPSDPAGPSGSLRCDGVVVLRSSSASALLESIEELRRHMHEPHGGYGGFGDDDTVSREKKMMFHSANNALDAAIADVRRQMEATNARQPQDNNSIGLTQK